jgi:hypothetical protein
MVWIIRSLLSMTSPQKRTAETPRAQRTLKTNHAMHV